MNVSKGGGNKLKKFSKGRYTLSVKLSDFTV